MDEYKSMENKDSNLDDSEINETGELTINEHIERKIKEADSKGQIIGINTIKISKVFKPAK